MSLSRYYDGGTGSDGHVPHYCDTHHVYHDDGCPDCDALYDAAWEADADLGLVDCAACGILAEPVKSMGVLPVLPVCAACAACAEQERREVIEHERRRLVDYARPMGCRS